MKSEIERKFLLREQQATALKLYLGVTKKSLSQGYLAEGDHVILRVRIADDKAFITIKERSGGMARLELEVEIELEEGNKLLSLCSTTIEKTRYYVPYQGLVIELDEFLGNNSGLLMAEIEFTTEAEAEAFDAKELFEKEVTSDFRYYNSYLAEHPYTSWAESDQ